jgi:very-short-patch-repair endonuclease
VRVALVFAGLAPEAQYDVVEAGQWLARVDFAWPDARVALEYDGEHHFEDDQIPQDDERLRRLRDSGWVVLRIAAPDLRNLDGVVTRVRQTLNAR